MPANPDFLDMLRRVADDTGCLLILDEVITFRLGYTGAQGRFGVRPDLTCLGKIIGGGFPVGAIGGRADVMSVFDPSKGKPAVPHGGTFSANPMTMVAGLASMQALTLEAFAHLEALGAKLQTGLSEVMESRQVGGQVTGLGSLRRIHFTRNYIHDYRSIYMDDKQAQYLKAVHHGMMDAGVLIAPTGLMALSTAMSTADIDQIIDAFDRGIAIAGAID
jgi:glutamate-1-semialdehyde 2,1-aminomutase